MAWTVQATLSSPGNSGSQSGLKLRYVKVQAEGVKQQNNNREHFNMEEHSDFRFSFLDPKSVLISK